MIVETEHNGADMEETHRAHWSRTSTGRRVSMVMDRAIAVAREGGRKVTAFTLTPEEYSKLEREFIDLVKSRVRDAGHGTSYCGVPVFREPLTPW